MRTDVPSSILSISNVSKKYGKLTALDQTSFEIVPGEVFALLGPNGAGKTTLIGCVTGLISQFSGQISVAGKDVKKAARVTRQLVGLVPQELNFDPFFCVEDLLFYHSGFYNCKPDKAKIHKLLSDFGLYEKRRENTRALSGGMKRRLMICKALLHDPILVFLDEPTAGVDVELREELWEYMEGLKAEGVTIFLTTHYLEEAEKLADRIGFINKGKMLLIDERIKIMERYSKRWNEIKLSEPISEALKIELLRQGTEIISNKHIRIHSSRSGNVLPIHEILTLIFNAGIQIESVDGGQASLESIFRELMRNDYSI
jgi:ABC-2 type transport system ATP-binding protein